MLIVKSVCWPNFMHFTIELQNYLHCGVIMTLSLAFNPLHKMITAVIIRQENELRHLINLYQFYINMSLDEQQQSL